MKNAWAFVGSIPIVGFVLVLMMQRDDNFAMLYAKQGLVLGILAVAVDIVLGVLGMWYASRYLNLAVLLVWLVLIVRVAGGKTEPLPVLGQLAEKIKV